MLSMQCYFLGIFVKGDTRFGGEWGVGKSNCSSKLLNTRYE